MNSIHITFLMLVILYLFYSFLISGTQGLLLVFCLEAVASMGTASNVGAGTQAPHRKSTCSVHWILSGPTILRKTNKKKSKEKEKRKNKNRRELEKPRPGNHENAELGVVEEGWRRRALPWVENLQSPQVSVPGNHTIICQPLAT